MSTDKVRKSRIRCLIKQLRAGRPYQKVLEEDCVGCFITVRLYEKGTRELCDEVEGLLREVERDDDG